MKPEKGQKIKDWLESGKLDERNITTARVFLVVGVILGFLIGISF